MFKFLTQPVATTIRQAVGFLTGDTARRPRDVGGAAMANELLGKARAMAVANAGGAQAMDDASGSSIKAAYRDIGSDFGLSDVLLRWFMTQTFVSPQVCGMIAQHWLVMKACFMPARDAVRKGFIITSDTGDDLSPEVMQAFKKQDERYKLNDHLVNFVGMGRVQGTRLCLFKVRTANPKEYYENPFNPDAVTAGSYEGMVQIDPYWASPVMDTAAASDPTAFGFYEPTWWIISGQKYHRSHFAIFRHGEVADILKPVYLYGGIPVPQQIAERVYCAERTANEAPQLTMTKRLNVLQVDGAAAVAKGDEFADGLRRFTDYRDNFGVQVVDKETEGVEQHDTSLADLDAVIMSQYQIVAAVAGVPATKLLGTTPKGFNATGEYDEKNYHEELESVQAHALTPLVERHHDLVMRSFIAPKVLNGEPIDTTTVWEPLDSPTQKEQADAQLAEANRDKALNEIGAIDGQDVRNRLRQDRMSGYYGIEEAAPELPEEPPAPITVATPGEEVALTGDAADPIRIVSNQKYLNPDIVAAKVIDRDFDVQVSPCFVDGAGQRYRVVIDGHHSLAAARAAGVEPNFVEGDYLGSDYDVIANG